MRGAPVGSHHEQETGKPRAGAHCPLHIHSSPCSAMGSLYGRKQITASLSGTARWEEMFSQSYGREHMGCVWEGQAHSIF